MRRDAREYLVQRAWGAFVGCSDTRGIVDVLSEPDATVVIVRRSDWAGRRYHMRSRYWAVRFPVHPSEPDWERAVTVRVAREWERERRLGTGIGCAN